MESFKDKPRDKTKLSYYPTPTYIYCQVPNSTTIAKSERPAVYFMKDG
jgi:hypothetical protein